MSKDRLMIIRPDGAQGAKIGIQLSGKDDVKKLDEELSSIPNGNKKTIEDYQSAATRAGLNIVKP